jgi:hypothetical protein
MYLFDIYTLEEGGRGFAVLHVYVCCALLRKFRKELLQCNDSTDAMLFMQALPTSDWTLRDIKVSAKIIV